MNIFSDRRQETRNQLPVHVNILSNSNLDPQISYHGKLWNISFDGISFSLANSLHKDKRYQIEIQVDENLLIQSQIQILWIAPKKQNQILHGARLICSSESQTKILTDFFNSILEKKEKQKPDRRVNQRRSPKGKQIQKDSRKEDRRFNNRIQNLSKSGGFSRTVNGYRTIKLRRVVITGIGVVAPNGIGKEEFLSSLLKNQSGISKLTKFKNKSLPCQSGGQISDEKLWDFLEELNQNSRGQKIAKNKIKRRTDRPVQFALAASLEALKDAQLNLSKINGNNIGVALGTIMSGLGYAFKEHDIYNKKGMHRMDPYTVAAASPNSCSGELSAEFKLRGPSVTFSQGCTSGAMAMDYAFDQIQKGKVPIMLAGGTDSPFQESTFAAFCRSGMLSPTLNGAITQPKPFDKQRNGIVISEGAAVLIFEDLDHAIARKADIYAEVLADYNTCDGFDMIKWRWHGKEITRAIKIALEEGNVAPNEISVIFAQGSGSYQGDGVEARAILNAFGQKKLNIPITNVKGLIGYTQGACAPIEMAAACLSIKEQFLPAIPTFEESELPIKVNKKVIKHPVNKTLLNCIGFGGKNLCFVIGKLQQ